MLSTICDWFTDNDNRYDTELFIESCAPPATTAPVVARLDPETGSTIPVQRGYLFLYFDQKMIIGRGTITIFYLNGTISQQINGSKFASLKRSWLTFHRRHSGGCWQAVHSRGCDKFEDCTAAADHCTKRCHLLCASHSWSFPHRDVSVAELYGHHGHHNVAFQHNCCDVPAC